MSYLSMSIDPVWRHRVQALSRRVQYLDGFEMLVGTIYHERYEGTPLIDPERKEECVEAIWKLLSRFSEAEFDIVVLRFGLLNNRIATLAETARVLGLSVDKARSIEAKAIYQLSQNSCRRELAPFLELLTPINQL